VFLLYRIIDQDDLKKKSIAPAKKKSDKIHFELRLDVIISIETGHIIFLRRVIRFLKHI